MCVLNNVIPLNSVRQREPRCLCQQCHILFVEGGSELCQSCQAIEYFLDGYLETYGARQQSDEQLVDAIWLLQRTKVQVRQMLNGAVQCSQSDQVEFLAKLQTQLDQLSQSLEMIKKTDKLLLFMSIITREIQLMLQTKKADWWCDYNV